MRRLRRRKFLGQNGVDNPRENLFAPELIGVAVRFAIGQYVGKVVVPEFEAALPPQGLDMVVARRGVYIERGDVKRLAFESPVRSLAPQKNGRSEEHTSELQSLMSISYAGCCLIKKHKYGMVSQMHIDNT